MALMVGTEGSVAFADTSGASIVAMTLSKWTCNMPRGESDTTGFTPTSNLRTQVGGLRSINGTFEGYFDDTNAFDDTDLKDSTAASATITLTYNNNGTNPQKVAFSAWLSGCDVDAASDGSVITVRGSFQGTGLPSFTKV